MRKAGKRLQKQRSLWGRLTSEAGASLVVAILFFVLCGVGASVILAAASASAGKMKKVPGVDQKRFAVESAAGFLRDELKDLKVTITDIKVDDDREESADYSLKYVWKNGTEIKKEDSVLETLVDQIYLSQEEQDAGQKAPENPSENPSYDLALSVSTSKGTSVIPLNQLAASALVFMDASYQVKANIADQQTNQETQKEDLCERLLTVPAAVQTDETVDVKEYEETDEEGNVTDEWSITTTTRITTITWQRGTIERIHPKTGSTGD